MARGGARRDSDGREPRPDFARVVVDGENGLLAEERDGWARALEALVDDPERRDTIGRRARDDVLSAHTTRARALAYREALRGLVDEQPETLTINWVLHAPIAANSGGYRNIFRIASELGSRGHVQRLCVDPVAHLEGLSDQRITEFVDETFGIAANAEVVVGHTRLPAADVSVATFWTTAPIVAQHERSLFRAVLHPGLRAGVLRRRRPIATTRLSGRTTCRCATSASARTSAGGSAGTRD